MPRTTLSDESVEMLLELLHGGTPWVVAVSDSPGSFAIVLIPYVVLDEPKRVSGYVGAGITFPRRDIDGELTGAAVLSGSAKRYEDPDPNVVIKQAHDYMTSQKVLQRLEE